MFFCFDMGFDTFDDFFIEVPDNGDGQDIEMVFQPDGIDEGVVDESLHWVEVLDGLPINDASTENKVE